MLERWADPRALVKTGETRLTRLITKASHGQQGAERAAQWLSAAVSRHRAVRRSPRGAIRRAGRRGRHRGPAAAGHRGRAGRACQGTGERPTCSPTPASWPGPCPASATVGGPALVAGMGRPGRFADGAHFKSYTGLAPRASETGNTDRKGQPMSKAGSSLLRTTLIRAADHARKVRTPSSPGSTTPRWSNAAPSHLKACCVVAAHLAERAWAVMHRGRRTSICDNDGEPRHPRAGKEDHRGEVDRPRGRPQAPPQRQAEGEGPSAGPSRAW